MTRLAVLGDSIAWGLGAAREEDRLAAVLVSRLAEQGVRAEARVFAVPGSRSAGLAAQVDDAILWEPHVCVLIIGANDLTHLVPVTQAAKELGEAVRRLRDAGREVVVAPAPDLSTVPHVPPALREVVQAASAELRQRQVAVVTRHGARVADADAATARAFREDPRLFSHDRFHPSSAGYAVIATALMPEVLASARRTDG
jgi:lysophospholipase L1-like esterase